MNLNLESDRLRIRNLTEEDLHHFFQYRSDPEVCRYQDWEAFDKETTLEFIKDQKEKSLHNVEEWIQLAIELKHEDRLIGDIALRRFDKDGSLVEVGYAITPTHQRQGYAFEALQLLIHHLFEHLDIHKVTARVDPRNEGSLGLLDRLNFIKEGHIRKCFYDQIDNEWVDEMVFGLLSEDYVKAINNWQKQLSKRK